jgi:hypothetical protein
MTRKEKEYQVFNSVRCIATFRLASLRLSSETQAILGLWVSEFLCLTSELLRDP